MALYLFMNSEIHEQSGLFKDAVTYGGFKLAPIDDYKKQSAINYCNDNDIAFVAAGSDRAIKAITNNEKVVIMTNYEDAKIICNHFTPDINEE